ncbi:MAG: hypothetical protein ACLFPO_02560 [Spirochaetaceae bacterium]
MTALVIASTAAFAQDDIDDYPEADAEPPWLEDNGTEAGDDEDTDETEREPTDPLVDPASREAIFDTQLGDADVDLFIVGSWNTGIGGTLGWAFHPEIPPEDTRVTFPYDFPGMEPVPYFNAVDLTLSLWLYERYYLEATFVDEFEVNSFILGYQGHDDEFVQSVRLGYGLLSISDYPYIPFAEATESSPGASARFRTERSEHELLLRYEPSAEQRKIFYGMNEASEKRIAPSSWSRGRFFVLPDADVENLTLYIEDDDGNISAKGGTWREADLDAAAVYSAEKGFIYLREQAEGRVAVHYTKGGATVGDDDLGGGALVGVDDSDTPGDTTDDVLDPGSGTLDFDFGAGTYLGLELSELELTVAGDRSLLLYRPGAFNPFEIANRYDISDLSSAQDLETEFVRKGEYSEREVAGQAIAVNEDQTLLSVINADRNPRHHSNRYPFAEDYPELYGPNPTDKDGYTDFEILATGLSPVAQLTIDGNVVPGSVTVLRNGVEDPSFEVNHESGVITSPFPIFPNDVIEVVYRVYGSGGGGDLLAAGGNRISLGPQTDLTLALGTRWNLVGGDYSVSPTDHPGSVTASAAVEHTTDYFSGYLDAAVQLSVPDTTDYLRLLGMEEKETEVPAADGNMFPAAAPGDGDWTGTLEQDNRGRLFYRNFYEETALGGQVLRDYDWDVPDDQDYPYAPGSRVGPYPAKAADDGVDGQVMVLDFEMQDRPDDDEDEEWVGAHLRMPDLTDRDFSEITEISFEWRTLDLDPGDVEVYLQIGSIAEDLDGDETLDRGESTLSPSFDFDDQSAGFTLKAGRPPPGEDYRMSEDGNRNGVLDPEDPDLVHTIELDSIPSDDWQRVSFDLDAAARRKLAATRAVRVVVRRVTTGTIAGRALFSKFTLRGSTFQTAVEPAPPAGSVSATEVPDRGAPKKLIDEHEEVDEVFHAEGGGNQRVLRVDWDGLDGAGDSWSLTDYVTSVPARQYEVLAFYARLGNLRPPDPDPDTDSGAGHLTVTLAESKPDGSGRGERLEATVPMSEDGSLAGPEWGSGRWRKVELDTAAGKVYVDGDEVGSLADKPSGGTGDLSFLEFEFEPEDTDADAGTIYIDEVHWAETRITMSGASRLSATYEYPDTVIRAGEVEVLSNVRVSQDTSVRSGGFTTPSEIAGGTGSFLTRTELAGDLLYTRLETDVQVAVQDERTSLAGGHSLRVPAADAPVVFTESYRRNYNAPLTSLNRSNGLLLSLPLETRIRLDSEATLREENLDQSWDLSAGISPTEQLSFDLAAGLGHSAGGYTAGDASYPESWILGYELVAPYTAGDSPTRRGEASVSAEREPAPAGLDVAGNGAYENRSSTENEQTNETSLAVGVPLAFNRDSPRSWTLTPSYSRSFARTLTAPAAASYEDDLGVYGDAFAGQRYLATSVPIAELFQSAEHIGFAGRSAGEPFTRYTPRGALSLERGFGSRLRDLVLPSAADMAVERSFTREEEAVTEVQRYSASYTATAVNLFGRVGAYPTFALYRTDEFSNSLSATVDRRFPAEETAVTGELSSLVALFGEEDNEFRLSNTAEGTVDAEERSLSVESEASYVWQRPAERVFGLERLLTDRPPYFAHTEQARFLYDEPGGEDEERTYSITLGHETRLVFPEHGFIRLYADLGFGLQPAVIEGEEVNVALLGMQGGIEGKIEF